MSKILNPFELASLRKQIAASGSSNAPSEAYDSNHSLEDAEKDSIFMSPKRKSKYSQKQEKKLLSPEAIKAEADIAHKVLGAKAIRLVDRKPSSLLQIARRSQMMKIICEATGIVSYMEIPLIPEAGLTYYHPLAILSNCRGLAQQGENYLSLLDTTVLAGILLVIAEPYNLLQAQPTDSAAQRNAVLRTAGKNNLIQAILFIENLVHSSNAPRIPSLSIAMEGITKDLGIEGPFTQWLKVSVEAVYKPDYSIYDEAAALAERKQWFKNAKKEASNALIRRASPEALARKSAEKAWNKAKKEAKPSINTLYKNQAISLKLKNFLLAICEGDTLLSADDSLISLLIQKLEALNNPVASSIAASMTSAREALGDNDDPFADTPIKSSMKESSGGEVGDSVISSSISAVETSFASMPIGSYLGEAKDKLQTFEETPKETPKETPTKEEKEEDSPSPSEKPLTFLEKIRAKRLEAEALAKLQDPSEF